ncbi:MAG: hypothetical protein HY917_02625, partial [Candidatus Diapherotrites archaeon]|nr:hypothetical protein [Candidatus Diapherotrites archaeon]
QVSSVGDQYAFAGEPFGLQISAFDFEGNPLAFSDDSELFEIDSNGFISFMPALEQIGTHLISVTVSDGNISSSVRFSLHVQKKNSVPFFRRFVPSAEPVVMEGRSLDFSVEALDNDGDPLTFQWLVDGTPVGTDIAYSLLPDANALGDHLVEVTVSDGTDSVTRSWNVRVIPFKEVPKQCVQLPDRGSCRGFEERFYFDWRTNACASFVWGGCGGSVPFDSLDSCTQACGAGG